MGSEFKQSRDFGKTEHHAFSKAFSGSRFITYGRTDISRWIGGSGQGRVEKSSSAKDLFETLSTLRRTQKGCLRVKVSLFFKGRLKGYNYC